MRAKKVSKSGNRKQAAYRFSPQFIEVLKAISKQSGISQSRIIERCVLANVDAVTAESSADAELLKNPGATAAAIARTLEGSRSTSSKSGTVEDLAQDLSVKVRRRQA